MTERKSTFQMIGAAAGMLGLLLAAAALGFVLVQGNWEIPRYMLIAALVLLTVFVWLNPEAIAQAITGRGTRYGANAVLRVLVAVGIAPSSTPRCGGPGQCCSLRWPPSSA